MMAVVAIALAVPVVIILNIVGAEKRDRNMKINRRKRQMGWVECSWPNGMQFTLVWMTSMAPWHAFIKLFFPFLICNIYVVDWSMQARLERVKSRWTPVALFLQTENERISVSATQTPDPIVDTVMKICYSFWYNSDDNNKTYMLGAP